MNALVIEAVRRGLNVHVHAIGDLAVKASLDAFEAARKAVPGSYACRFRSRTHNSSTPRTFLDSRSCT